MTIDEAIKENDYLLKAGTHRLTPSELKAVKLGKEALKYYKRTHVPHGNPAYCPLPGETK